MIDLNKNLNTGQMLMNFYEPMEMRKQTNQPGKRGGQPSGYKCDSDPSSSDSLKVETLTCLHRSS